MSVDLKKDIKKYLTVLIAFLGIVLLAVIIIDSALKSYVHEVNFTALGSSVSAKISVKDGKSAKDSCEAFQVQLEKSINNLEYNLISRRAESSDIAKINSAAGNFVEVSDETAQYLSDIIAFSNDCNGKFDITVGALSQLWDVTAENPKVPSSDEISSLLADVGYSAVEISGNSIRIAEGQVLDLGAAGKGIACDIIKEQLSSLENVKSATVSVGGSLLLFGDEKDHWNIAIKNPREGQDSYLGNLRLGTCFVSTSGDYEKYFEQDSIRYHHILDPKTGYPVRNGIISVTVICDNGLLSDALSTACFAMGYKESLPLLAKYNAQAVFVDENMQVRITDGLSDKFHLTCKDYTLAE